MHSQRIIYSLLNVKLVLIDLIILLKLEGGEPMEKTYKVTALCGMGLGSSSLARMAIIDFAKTHNIKASVNVADIGMIKGIVSDIIVTTKSMSSHIPKDFYDNMKIVFVTNLIAKKELNEKLEQVFKELGAL